MESRNNERFGSAETRNSFPSSSSESAQFAAQRTADEAIRVCVRIRPLNDTEINRNDKMTTGVYSDGQTIELHTPKLSRRFTYDFVMDHTLQQDDVFKFCGVKDLIEMALRGYSTTVLAYGQTGSGKTFTIMGREGNRETIERCLPLYYN